MRYHPPMRALLAFGSFVYALAFIQAATPAQATDVSWALNGGVDNIRYSPLTQINRDNVA